MATSKITKFGDDIVLTKNQVEVTFTAANTRWEITGTKSGYYPLIFSIQYGFSTALILAPEFFEQYSGSFKLGGFGRCTEAASRTAVITASILWKRNS